MAWAKRDSSKMKVAEQFFQTFLNVPHQALCRKNTLKRTGHHERLRDMLGQSYPFMPNHACCFIFSR